MPKPRVDLLEVVRINHQKSEWRVLPPRMTDEPSRDFVQGATVIYLGKWICERLLLDGLDSQGAGDELLTQAAHLKTLCYKVRIQQRQQGRKCNYKPAQLDVSFAALSDATRRGILEQLGRADASITE